MPALLGGAAVKKVDCPEGLTEAYERFLKSGGNHQLTRIYLDRGNHRHISFRSVDENGQRSGFYWYDLVTFPGAGGEWGTLVFRGDMGTFVFSRTTDMFQFFRIPSAFGLKFPTPNLGYWAEKLVGPTDGRESVTAYDQELLLAAVRDEVEDFIRQHMDDADERKSEPVITETVHVGDVELPVLEYGHKGQDFEPHALSSARARLIKGGEPEWAARLRQQVLEDIEEELIGDYSLDLETLSKFRFYIDDVEYDEYGHRKPSDLSFEDAYEYDVRDYTWHYVWACFAIMQGIRLYDEHKAARKGLRGLPLRWRTRWDWWRQDRAVARRKRRREREMNRKLAAERAAKNKAATTKES